jgi:hypothetical protein
VRVLKSHEELFLAGADDEGGDDVSNDTGDGAAGEYESDVASDEDVSESMHPGDARDLRLGRRRKRAIQLLESCGVTPTSEQITVIARIVKRKVRREAARELARRQGEPRPAPREGVPFDAGAALDMLRS